MREPASCPPSSSCQVKPTRALNKSPNGGQEAGPQTSETSVVRRTTEPISYLPSTALMPHLRHTHAIKRAMSEEAVAFGTQRLSLMASTTWHQRHGDGINESRCVSTATASSSIALLIVCVARGGGKAVGSFLKSCNSAFVGR